MRQVFPALAILLLGSACTGSGINEELRIELLEMARVDQELQGRAMALVQGLPETQAEFVLYVEEQNQLYATHFARLEEIISVYGWPGRSLAGEDGNDAALILLSHATVDQRKMLLPTLREAVAADEMEASRLARAEDSISVDEGKGQIYGTYFISDSNGNPMLAPVEDPENLEERRMSVGLPSMGEQFEQLEQELGMPIGRGNLATDEN